jgi:DnaJ family protein A protein 2
LKGLDGKEFNVSSVPGEIVQDKDIKSVKGKGLPYYRDAMSHGNLIIKFTIKFPRGSDLSEDVRAAIEKVKLFYDSSFLDQKLPQLLKVKLNS